MDSEFSVQVYSEVWSLRLSFNQTEQNGLIIIGEEGGGVRQVLKVLTTNFVEPADDRLPLGLKFWQ